MDNLNVLIVDDERISRLTMQRQLQEVGYGVEAVENPHLALEHLESGAWDVVLSDLRMPGMDGLSLLREIKSRFRGVDIMLMTAYGSVETAVSAMQEGAADYLTKPFTFQELSLRLEKLKEIRQARKEITVLRAILEYPASEFGLVGHSAQMISLHDSIHTFADHSAPVLVTGETGTGKELVARALHMNSGRSKGPFVPVTCGSIPKELAESELFGHEKGAFTHAIQKRQGSFERAHEGTLLLDDVDDLPLEIQVKLLRVLQEGVISRVGGNAEIQVDARVIATTKVDLSQLVGEGRFRDDLFYRLRGLEIHLSPLRERGNDVLLLAQHFIDLQDSKEGGAPKRLSIEAARIISRYAWPGNVRELQHAIESALVLCPQEEIRPEHLPVFLRYQSDSAKDSPDLFTLHLDDRTQLSYSALIQQVEDRLIQWALAKSGGSQSQAADLLNLPRTTFQSKLNRNRPS